MTSQNKTLLLLGAAFLAWKFLLPKNDTSGGGGNTTPSAGAGASQQGDNSGNTLNNYSGSGGPNPVDTSGGRDTASPNSGGNGNGPVLDQYLDNVNNSFDNRTVGNTGGVY